MDERAEAFWLKFKELHPTDEKEESIKLRKWADKITKVPETVRRYTSDV